MQREADRRGFSHAPRRVVLGDGAVWIWNIADALFPGAIQIVDRYHVKEHLCQVAKAIWGAESSLVAPWAKERHLGTEVARRVRRHAALLLRCPEEEIFLASTGVIGVTLPDAKIRAALRGAVARLSACGLGAASHAIMATDVGPKVAQGTFRWAGRKGRIVGVAKGAGMIHPNMATMLAFVMTDAPADPAFLREALKEATRQSFNAVSVDGDTSTNDTVLSAPLREGTGAPLDRSRRRFRLGAPLGVRPRARLRLRQYGLSKLRVSLEVHAEVRGRGRQV